MIKFVRDQFTKPNQIGYKFYSHIKKMSEGEINNFLRKKNANEINLCTQKKNPDKAYHPCTTDM